MYKFISIIFIFTSLLVSQPIDSTITKYGFVVEMTGYTISQFGMRYRISESSQLLLTTNGGIFSEKDDVERNISVASIGEIQLYKNESAELFLSIGVKYNTEYKYYTYSSIVQNNVRITEYASRNINRLSGVLGVGASYQLSKMLVLFCHQNMELTKSHSTDTYYLNETRDYTSINVVESRLGLTIYF